MGSTGWVDGILTALWRKSLRSTRKSDVWFVFDGTPSAEFGETLAVAIDNGSFNLPTGERLGLSQVRFIFEVRGKIVWFGFRKH